MATCDYCETPIRGVIYQGFDKTDRKVKKTVKHACGEHRGYMVQVTEVAAKRTTTAKERVKQEGLL